MTETAGSAGQDLVTDSAACPSTYGILICERPFVGLHGARLANGETVTWGDGCNEICRADCPSCKGALGHARMLADIDAADEDD